MKKHLLLYLSILFSSSLFAGGGEFLTWWQLPAAQTSITFNVEVASGGDLYYWWYDDISATSGNGTFAASTSGSVTVSGVPAGGHVQLGLGPSNLNHFYISNGPDRLLLEQVASWGVAQWTSMDEAFYGCSNLQITSTASPNLSNCMTAQKMFKDCSSISNITNVENWDVSSINDMLGMFQGATQYNQNISSWDVSNVTSMSNMFTSASLFNQPIGIWNTSSVNSFRAMFASATSFNQDISSWNTSNAFDFGYMFQNASAFNQPIGIWNTVNATDMGYMFNIATSFNQNIGNWNTSNVVIMYRMFEGATNFNGNIGNWNTSFVTSMQYVFSGATVFNQDINNWNTSSVITMIGMFENATAFNQNLGSWDLTDLTIAPGMFAGSGMSCDNYSNTLIGWNGLVTTPDNIDFSINNGMFYGTNAVSARDSLINTKNWTIDGDAASGTDCSLSVNEGENISLLTVSPNPATQNIFIQSEIEISFVILDNNGRELFKNSVNGKQNIDVSTFAQGMYFIHTSEGETVKFIKE